MTAETPDWSMRGPGPYPLVYTAMLVNGLALIYAVYGQRPEDAVWLKSAAGAFAVMAALLAVARVVFHDVYVSMTPAMKAAYFLLNGVLFCAPGVVQGHGVIPEGFAVALPAMALSAVNGRTLRRWTLFSMLGFWFAAFSATPPSAPLILLYGFSLLWLFAATHFAETGEPYGLRGWWPARTTLQLAALYALPAGLMAMGTYFLWPDLRPAVPAASAAPPITARAVMRLSPDDMRSLLIRFLIWFGLIAFSLVLITIVRRRLGRRRRPEGLPKVFGMDVGDLQFFRGPEMKPGRGLGGERGLIVRMWMKWARERGEGRAESETAREVAARVTLAEGEEPRDRRTLTELLERAHYGAEEPTTADVEAMKQAVKRELKR